MTTKNITLLEDGKTYHIDSEEAFKKFLASRETSCLVDLQTRERVSSFASLVPGGTYYSNIVGKNNTKTMVIDDKATFIDMQIKVAHQHWREYQYEKARAAFELVLSHQRQYIGGEEDRHYLDIVTIHLHLGTLKALQGDFAGGIESYQQALALAFKVFGGNFYHPKVAEIYNAAGNLFFHVCRPRDALNMYKCTLAIHAKIFGKESEYFAHACSNCGLALEQLGRYQDALTCHQKALSIIKLRTFHHHGDDRKYYPIKVARILCDMASSLNRQGQYREAREHYQAALSIQRTLYCSKIEEEESSNSLCCSVNHETGRGPSPVIS